MSGSALLAVSYRLLADAASSAEPTDWWRIIGLAAVTIATVAILAILFRPGALGRPEAPEPGEPATGPSRPPGLYPLPQRPLGDPAMDTTRAAERLRQIVSQPSTAETERRSPAAARDKQPERGPSATDSKEQTPAGAGQTRDEGTAMESGDHGPTRAGTGPAAPTADLLQEQIDRYFHRSDRPANVVQFTPRKPAATADKEQPAESGVRATGRGANQPHSISQFPVDTAARDGINATIQELLFCANVGELLHGFALYTDRFLFQFMDESRMSEDEFRQAYSDIPAKDPSEWIRIDSISGFARLPDGRIMVRVRYIDGAEVNGAEQLTMKFDSHYARWLIDDIRAI